MSSQLIDNATDAVLWAGTPFYRALMHGDTLKPIACPEREVTRKELVGVVVDWASTNPQRMEELPVEAVVRAAVPKWGNFWTGLAAGAAKRGGERLRLRSDREEPRELS